MADDDTTEGPSRRSARGLGGVPGAALALVLVFAAVRLTASAPPPSSPDAISSPTATATSGPALFDIPTRGSLAVDRAWLSGIAALGTLAEVPTERRVAFAGEIGQQRVALVLGRGGGQLVAAWLTGPRGAAPEQMTAAAPPYPVTAVEPLALWDAPEPDGAGLLVVVARPGDDVAFLPGRSVDADGTEQQVPTRLSADAGVAIASVDPPAGSSGAALVTVRGDASEGTFAPLLSDRARRAADAPVDPADPRGLRPSVDERQLQDVLHELAGAYGLPPGRIAPTLLTAGPVGTSGDRAVLVGATLPSGATVAWLSVAGAGPGSPLLRSVATTPAPAGTALLDRVVAVPAGWAVSRIPLPAGDGPPGWLVISGPRGGATAELLSAGGRTLGTLPLVDGAGIGPVPPGTTAVRVLDATGAALGGARVAHLAG